MHGISIMSKYKHHEAVKVKYRIPVNVLKRLRRKLSRVVNDISLIKHLLLT